MLEEWVPDVRVDRRILDGCVGEHERRGIDPLVRIRWRISDQVASFVTEHDVEHAAIRAGILSVRERRECQGNCRDEQRDGTV